MRHPSTIAKLTIKISLSSVMGIIAMALHSPATARPYPDEVAVCYAFQGDTLERREPCVISAGYGAGAHYATLHWLNESSTTIYMINACSDMEYDDRGFCAYLVDDQDATPYERDIFLNVASVDDPDNMPCFRTIETHESVCYRF